LGFAAGFSPHLPDANNPIPWVNNVAAVRHALLSIGSTDMLIEHTCPEVG
jgi:hypothetical protein